MLTHSASLTSSVIDVVDVVCVSSVKIFSSLTMSFSLSFSQITKENSLERGAISLRQLSFLLFSESDYVDDGGLIDIRKCAFAPTIGPNKDRHTHIR